MLFKRKILNKLVRFKEAKHSKPQVILGVRQCGKTTTVLEYARSYKNYIYINFEAEPDIRAYFETATLHPQEIIEYLMLIKGEPFHNEQTLIIFDEIQVSERALTSLKYFAEAEVDYKVIALGSLLGTTFYRYSKTKNSFPVGKVHLHTMYPLNFEEYLLATGNERYIDIIKNAYEHSRLEDSIHKQILKIFDIYTQIGGMPEAVSTYLDTKDLVAVKEVHQSLLTGYFADMMKYADNSTQAQHVKDVYESLPMQLGQENQKFMTKHVHKNGSMRTYSGAIGWLVSSNMCLKVRRLNKITQPLRAEQNQFKLFLHDIGLLNTWQDYNVLQVQGDDRIYLGIIMENYAAMELIQNHQNLFYFDDNKKEIDYIIRKNNSIIPLEIKASNNVKAKSLQTYMQQQEPEYAIRVSRRNFGLLNDIKSIPLYALWLV